jgi:RNA polymerase sigma factor (sigma-70 family)
VLGFGGEREAVSKVGLTAADLVAARLREPAAVTRIYTAYAPALFRFFMAAVGDRHLAEDLTGNTFVSAIEDLPKFRGPVEALGGWLFQIARHDLYDHRRKQSRSRTEPLDQNLEELAVRTETDETTLAELFRGLATMRDPAAGALLNRLSPKERAVLWLVVDGRTNAEIGRHLLISLHTVQVYLRNILEKLQLRSKQEVVAFVRDREWLNGAEELDPLFDRVEDRRVIAALRKLNPDQREVLVLRMLSGLTIPEVAAVLGKTTGAVKAAQHRGLVRLARMLVSPDPG